MFYILLNVVLMTYIGVKVMHYTVTKSALRKRELLYAKGYGQRDVSVTVAAGVGFIVTAPILGVYGVIALSDIIQSGLTESSATIPTTPGSIAALVLLTLSIVIGVKGASKRIEEASNGYRVFLFATLPLEIMSAAASIYLVVVFALGAILYSALFSKQSKG